MQEAHGTFPNKVEAFFIVAALLVLEIVAALVLQQLAVLDGMDPVAAGAFVSVVGNGLVFTLVLSFKRLGYRQLFHPSTNSVAATLLVLAPPILLLAPGLLAVTASLNVLVQWLLPMSSQQRQMLDEMVGPSAVTVLFTCIAGPVLEEMLFRGVILRSFLAQYSRAQAVLWSAFIFALAHLNVYQFVTAGGLGLVLGWLYDRSRSLWPAILLHATFNSLVTLSANTNLSAGASTLWLWLLAFGCAIGGGLVLVRVLETGGRAE
jgi:uncharacterized protein